MDRPQYYMLIDRVAVPCDIDDFLRFMSDPASRTVARDQIGAVLVSTVFLGLDHNHNDGPPLLFETMVFGESGSGEEYGMWRTSTYASALTVHGKIVDGIRAQQAVATDAISKASKQVC